MIITDDQLSNIQYGLEGTCRSIQSILEEYDINEDPNKIEDMLLDGSAPIERCVECNWWYQSCMLEYSESLGGGICEQCEDY